MQIFFVIAILVYLLITIRFRRNVIIRDLLLFLVTIALLSYTLLRLIISDANVEPNFFELVKQASEGPVPAFQEKAPIQISGEPRTNLCVQGSGAGMIGMAGALYALRYSNFSKGLKKVAGVSSGSFLSYLLALGYTEDELVRIVYNLDVSLILGGAWYKNFAGLYSSFGFYSMDRLRNLIRALEDRKNAPAGFTFKQLKETRGKELYVVAVNLNQSKTVTFSADSHPDLPIVDAVTASMCVPFLFQPVVINKELYIDGAAGSNFPIFLFKEELSNTIGFKIMSNEQTKRDEQIFYPNFTIDNVLDYSKALVEHNLFQLERLYLQQGKDFWDHVIAVPFKGEDAFEFSVSAENKLKFMQTAYDAAYKQIEFQRGNGFFQSIRFPPPLAEAAKQVSALSLDPIEAAMTLQ